MVKTPGVKERTLTSTVLDPTGAVIPGVQMTLTGVDTGVWLSTLTNEAGVYRFDAVDLGVYDLTAAHPGFQAYSATAINVEANRVTTLDPRLELGAAETRIEVSGETSELLVRTARPAYRAGGREGRRHRRSLANRFPIREMYAGVIPRKPDKNSGGGTQ